MTPETAIGLSYNVLALVFLIEVVVIIALECRRYSS